MCVTSSLTWSSQIVTLPHLSWQTDEELKTATSINRGASSVEGDVEASIETETESGTGNVEVIRKGPKEHGLEKKMGDVENGFQAKEETENGYTEGETPGIADNNLQVQEETEINTNMKLGGGKDSILSNNNKTDEHLSDLRNVEENITINKNVENEDQIESQSPARENFEEQELSADDSNFLEELSSTSFAQSISSDDTEESDWSFLTQLADRQRNDSDTSDSDHKLRKVSLSTEGDNEADAFHSYINYGLDDEDILEALTNPPPPTGAAQIPEDAPHLDTIAESDESGEDDDNEKKITMPSQMKSNFSGGMLNLQDISSDGSKEVDLTLDLEESDNAVRDKYPEEKEEEEEDSEEHNDGGSSSHESPGGDISKSQDGGKEQQDTAAITKGVQRRLKKGRIDKRKNVKPIFLSEDLRTFNNPISYLGGPNITYDEDAASKRDSMISITSLD